MGSHEWTMLLERMEKIKVDSRFVVVIVSSDRPWIKKYAWFAGEKSPHKLKEAPEGEDHLYLAVRNPGIGLFSIDFECQSQHGKIKFDKSVGGGFSFTERILAVPALGGGPSVPIARSTRVLITDTAESSEVVSVKALTFEEREPDRHQVGSAEVGRLVVHFL